MTSIRIGIRIGAALAIVLLAAQPAAAAEPAATILTALVDGYCLKGLTATAPTANLQALGFAPKADRSGARAPTAEGGWTDISPFQGDPAKEVGCVFDMSYDQTPPSIRNVLGPILSRNGFSPAPVTSSGVAGEQARQSHYTARSPLGLLHVLYTEREIFQESALRATTKPNPNNPMDGVDTLMIWLERGFTPPASKK